MRRAPPDTLVLAGQADPGTVGRPMELLLDAVDTAVHAATPPGTDGDDGDDRDDGDHRAEAALLAQVCDPDRPADGRTRAGVELVRRLGAGRSTLVVFEDLHWADSESVAAFERLAEPDQLLPSLAAAGCDLSPYGCRAAPSSEALPRLDRRHSVTHVHLDRLTPADVSNFLAAVYAEEPSFRTVDTLHRRTGGNPFFLEELAAATGDMPGRDDDAPLPWTVSELVRSELDDLDPAVRAMVSAASVLGRRVPFDLLAAVTGMSETELIDRLRAAIERGLLVEDDPDVRLRHELARRR